MKTQAKSYNTLTTEQKQRYWLLKARNDFRTFVLMVQKQIEPKWNYQDKFFTILIDYLGQFLHNKEHKVFFEEAPPRTGKTELTTMFGVAYLLGRYSNKRFLITCGNRQLKRKIRKGIIRIITSDAYKKIFPNTITTDNSDVLELQNGNMILFTTISSAIPTGEGFHFIIFEDPATPRMISSNVMLQTVYEQIEGLLSRTQDDPETKLIVNSQRLGPEDVTARLVSQHDEIGVKYMRLTFPYCFDSSTYNGLYEYQLSNSKIIKFNEGEYLVDRFDVNKQLAIQAKVGMHVFRTQYQQNPIARDGQMISFQEHNYYDPKDLPLIRFNNIIMSVDTAMNDGENNDYTAFICIGIGADKCYYLLDAQRVKKRIIEMAEVVANFHDRVKNRFGRLDMIVIENKSHGIALDGIIQQQKVISSNGKPIYTRRALYTPFTSKIDRVQACEGILHYAFKIPRYADWINELAEYKNELEIFPNGKHDDFVDATTMALNWCQK